MRLQGSVLLFVLTALCAQTYWSQDIYAQSALDPNLPAYQPSDPLSGKITLAGSYTMSNLAAVWADGFRRFHPQVHVDIQVKGSINAVPMVAKGQADIGLLSRNITKSEFDGFQKAVKYQPKLLVPAMEEIAIYVHKDNPLQGLTLNQLASIYADSEDVDKIKTWGQAGVGGRWAGAPINLYGRSATTGSQLYFQMAVLRGQKFDSRMVAQKTNLDMVKTISSDKVGIGFAGIGYHHPKVKAVPLSVDGKNYIAVDSVAADQGRYPLVRPLQFVVNQKPGAKLPQLQQEFIRYVFSTLGQEDVVKGGFHPVTARPAKISLERVGLRSVN